MTDKTDKANLAKFGKDFQDNLVTIMLQDRAYCEQIREVLLVEHIEFKYLQAIVSRLWDYKDSYKVHPALKTFEIVMREDSQVSKNEALRNQVFEFFKNVQEKIQDEQFIKDQALNFCKKQKLISAIVKTVDLVQTPGNNENLQTADMSDELFEKVKKIINDSLNAGLDANVGHEYIPDFEKRYKANEKKYISTGWAPIDELHKGGLGSGELGVILAPSGAGKSFALTHLGAQALKAGKNVAHYPLEMDDVDTGLRYDSCLTGIPLDDLITARAEVKRRLDELEPNLGKLVIKEYAPGKASCNTIRNHIEKLKRVGTEIDLIIIDYGDLLRATTTNKEKRTDLEEVFKDMKALAKELKIPVWCASQTNRAGSDEEIVSLKHISESFAKVFIADLIISLSRRTDDKRTNSGRFFIAKNRGGKDNIVFPLLMDASRALIEVLDPADLPVYNEEASGDVGETLIRNLKKQFASKGLKKQDAGEF